jgi:hypothetical protein
MNTDDTINHYHSIRFRVVGYGILKTTLRSTDDVEIQSLVNLPMTPTTDRYPTILANFTKQHAQVHVNVTELGDWFRINRISIFIKPVSTSFPG